MYENYFKNEVMEFPTQIPPIQKITELHKTHSKTSVLWQRKQSSQRRYRRASPQEIIKYMR